MDFNKTYDMFNDDDIDNMVWHEFSDIPVEDRLHHDKKLCALLKIYSLLENHDNFDMSAEHDIVYLVPVDYLPELTEEDVLYLQRCGVFVDTDNECLALHT